MTKLFISDLHLEENRPDMVDVFLRFLKKEARNVQSLYILGDFFDYWIGDDDLSAFNRRIINALQAATQAGLPIFLVHGNRDFLLGKRFLQATGCVLLPEESVLDLYGTPTLLMHGDTLCTQDVAYLKFRKKVRHYWVQKLFLWKSLEKRKAIAMNYRMRSEMHTSTASENIMDVTQEEVERVMRKHQVQHLIHGHTHRQAKHPFLLDQKPVARIVLGAWHEYGNVLVCSETGEREFVELR